MLDTHYSRRLSPSKLYRRWNKPTENEESLSEKPSLRMVEKKIRRKTPSRKKATIYLVVAALLAAILFFRVTSMLRRVTVRVKQSPSLSLIQELENQKVPPFWDSSAAFELLRNEPSFGFVMKDLATRVLSRHVANSNVLVIAPDAKEAAANVSDDFSLAGTFVRYAKTEGHRTHAMSAGMQTNGQWTAWNTSLDQWWASFSEKRPNWILLAMVDPGWQWEDTVWIDSKQFLQESTITYIVTAVRSRLFPNGTVEMSGLYAVQALLDQRYKLQVLQVSHYRGEHDDLARVFEQYGPNRLFKSVDEIQSFLHWGAESAAHFNDSSIFTAYLFGTQGLDLAIPSRRHYIDDSSRVMTQVNLHEPLVLKPCPQAKKKGAIELSFEKSDGESDIYIRHMPVPVYSQVQQRKRRKSRFFRTIQDIWSSLKFAGPFLFFHQTEMTRSGIYISHTAGGDFVDSTYSGGQETLWIGGQKMDIWYDNDKPSSSEAACVRYDGVVDCKTRILHTPQENTLRKASPTNSNSSGVPTGMNVLVIMLDPMSRSHFERSMPRTRTLLQELGFLNCAKYSAVGDNSGPNQAALYSGKPLSDRDGVSRKGRGEEWLWDTLRRAGYVTLKGEDGCIENSNMLQSLKPNTTHGEALNQLFCFDFDRPNCLGPDLAASYLLRYGRQFIETYGGQPWATFLHFVDSHEDTMTLSTLLDSLFVKFIRELHDSGALSNTLVMVLSDHGLHYGPYFQTLSGRRERTEPLLYLRAPSAVHESAYGRTLEENVALWTTPFDAHQTMIDLTVGRADGDKTESLLTPLSSARKTCQETKAVPKRFCDMHQLFDDKKITESKCQKAPRPPAILSFFADIPRNRRPLLPEPKCSQPQRGPFDFEKECTCATSHRNVYPCKEHPWGAAGTNSTEREEEYYAIIKCKDRVERLENRVLRRQRLIDRSKSTTTSKPLLEQNVTGDKISRSPDILVLEIDSVSLAHADRHLPMTRKFLKKYRVPESGEGGKHHCTDGICALDFSNFAVVGPNSIVNQVAALSGCVVTRFHETCFDQAPEHDTCLDQGLFGTESGCEACPLGTFPNDPLVSCNTTKQTPQHCCTSAYQSKLNETRVCRDDSMLEHELQLFRRGPRRHNTWCPTNPKGATNKTAPWLFDVAKSSGYITYFGEEFCYDFSPFVTQDNTFPLETDFELRNVYCRLQSCGEKCDGPGPPMGPHICLDHDNENPAFSQISAIWETYHDVPKFAFLNGIAGHDYSYEWTTTVAALEAYDEQLVRFLERMTSQKKFEDTIIVVRTDHGLQGGPTTTDNSMQVEHREPWTQIVIPERLAGSLDIAVANQGRLATGYDLYHTLRNLMSSEDAAPIPSWSYDLLKTVIPRTRTCKEAKIPVDFCPCEGVGPDRPPHYGICNAFEPYQDMYCVGDDEPIAPEDSE